MGYRVVDSMSRGGGYGVVGLKRVGGIGDSIGGGQDGVEGGKTESAGTGRQVRQGGWLGHVGVDQCSD